ncbi:NAD-dependent malic enzyme [Gynuella sunshinyii]|uniref:Malolactic enzyme n=1 Tax=Gynuella sunshinyii YC6258 TaxID=1445510 RepID=A0A0C5VTY8_9GAMM|nr:NAD-dependent malic enzyme [Gynuella sunshinyii]AJQ97651.1 malic enzyme [Gynuella sunshinyii YC6258]
MNKKGLEILSNPRTNKGTAFTLEERQQLGLTGLLPPVVSTQQQQVNRSLANLRKKATPIDQYISLAALQKRNERVYYKILIDHIEEFMPVVYTPTVGKACQDFAINFRETNGCYISYNDRGNVEQLLQNWQEDVRLIVVTDGERILGLGDLGSNGMGIPIGKLSLYCACAGVDPAHCMPIMLDVGTDNEEAREDPFYLGLRQPRIRGEEYDAFVDEFVQAVKQRFPNALLQFEDFSTPNAVTLLERYRDQLLCFNDDIQGTAAVALAGLMAATRINGMQLKDMRFMFLGAGSAATGIGDLVAKAMQRQGLSAEEANARMVFNDSKGLVVKSRDYIKEHVRPFAADMAPMTALEALKEFRPHALIGATGRPGLITQEMVEFMTANNEHPIVFALSNPTANAECTAENAYQWSNGQAVFASGSPFDVVHINGGVKVPGQGNNAYIFPGLGLGALLSGATRINDDMLISAAETLAAEVSQKQIDLGCLYPPLKQIREVSAKIAVAVGESAQRNGLLKGDLPEQFENFVKQHQYDPSY